MAAMSLNSCFHATRAGKSLNSSLLPKDSPVLTIAFALVSYQQLNLALHAPAVETDNDRDGDSLKRPLDLVRSHLGSHKQVSKG